MEPDSQGKQQASPAKKHPKWHQKCTHVNMCAYKLSIRKSKAGGYSKFKARLSYILTSVSKQTKKGPNNEYVAFPEYKA